MAENLYVAEGTKAEKFEALIPQIRGVLDGESDMIARMANVAAMLTQTFGHFWTGFYRVDGETLVLGPFQGPLACIRIRYGRGVCGTAWAENRTVIVPDVELFPGHIACSSLSRSEIVVPVRKDSKTIAVLDIDSTATETFDDVDACYLEKICMILSES